jgi:hypothetical protein
MFRPSNIGSFSAGARKCEDGLPLISTIKIPAGESIPTRVTFCVMLENGDEGKVRPHSFVTPLPWQNKSTQPGMTPDWVLLRAVCFGYKLLFTL